MHQQIEKQSLLTSTDTELIKRPQHMLEIHVPANSTGTKICHIFELREPIRIEVYQYPHLV